jgi:hypothetical protein
MRIPYGHGIQEWVNTMKITKQGVHNVKITKSKLKQIIKEELEDMTSDPLRPGQSGGTTEPGRFELQHRMPAEHQTADRLQNTLSQMESVAHGLSQAANRFRGYVDEVRHSPTLTSALPESGELDIDSILDWGDHVEEQAQVFSGYLARLKEAARGWHPPLREGANHENYEK